LVIIFLSVSSYDILLSSCNSFPLREDPKELRPLPLFYDLVVGYYPYSFWVANCFNLPG